MEELEMFDGRKMNTQLTSTRTYRNVRSGTSRKQSADMPRQH